MANEAEIHRMAQSKHVGKRRKALEEYRNNFADFIDKDQAWKDLLELTKDENRYVRWDAAYALGSAFAHVTDKDQAWKDLLELTQDKDSGVRMGAARALGSASAHVTKKDQAWKDLLDLTKDKDSNVRMGAVVALGSAFAHVTDKEQATKDLLALTKNKDGGVRWCAAVALGSAFAHITDKDQAWKDLLDLTKDKYVYIVRRDAAAAIGSAFAHVADKYQATKDLLELTKDEDSDVRMGAAVALSSAFAHVTDKDQAWEDLLELTKDEDDLVRLDASVALGSAFAYVTDKYQATKDLLELTKDEDRLVRRGAAVALGSAFAHVTDKEQAWKVLLALIKDKDDNVRAHAYHSLGRACIFRATEAETEENFRKELENALEFFKKSSKERTSLNPAGFCLPFYRSFYTITFKKDNSETKYQGIAGKLFKAITFKKEDAEAEVQKYLNEAKNAVEGSKSKEKLLEAVKNLSNALKEAQQARDFNDMKHDFNAYRRYCDRAVELLDSTEDKTPGAAKVIRRGLPVIDERIKQILAEIQGKAKELCKQTQGTPFGDLGNALNKTGQNLLKIENPILLDKELCKIHFGLSSLYDKIPDDMRGDVPELLKEAEEEEVVERRLNLINEAFSKIISRISNINLTINVERGDLVMNKKTVIGGTGITAGGDIHISDVSGQVGAIRENITQTQTLSALDKKELMDSLLGFQKEVAKLGLPADEMSTVNGDVTAAIREAKKDEPDVSKIKSRFENAVDTIKEMGDSIEKVSKWEWTGKILKILGKLGFSILL